MAEVFSLVEILREVQHAQCGARKFSKRMGSHLMRSIGYCTNVHAGPTLDDAKQNLEKFAVRTREILHWDSLGVGLWLSDEGAKRVVEQEKPEQLRRWLADRNLRVFTMNGFPQGNFHEKVVKHRVYLPTWYEPQRLEYTRNLVQVLLPMIQPGEVGSISTLPIAWGTPRPSAEQCKMAAHQLRSVARDLFQERERSGREIVLAIEPEPGCALGDAASLRHFFSRYLLRDDDADIVRRHITVCHDICHSAVMREDQGRELQSYRELGLRIGKVQVSSAVFVDWDSSSIEQRRLAFQQLAGFAEDRYLHQTSTCTGPAGSVRLWEDLPILLANHQNPDELSGSWCVHFHVPIFATQLGSLGTTQAEIAQTVKFMQNLPENDPFFTGHWEVETYAWSVLPKEFAPSDLADGIASELRWFSEKR